MATAMFGAGCFWGIEAKFQKISGVLHTEVGYAGGHINNPTYGDVCAGHTGHAEVVRLEYDPQILSYEELLHAFFAMHDPTLLNRQGPDVGAQYRSVIFYYNPEQAQMAQKIKAEVDDVGHYIKSVVTEIVPASDFYRAEEYHQCYLQKKNG